VAHPNALTLDTDRSTPEQIAALILEHVRGSASRAGSVRRGDA